MQDLKKSVLEEFDNMFGELFVIANEQNDNSQFTTTSSYVGNLGYSVKLFLSTAIDKSFEAGRQQGIREAIECKPKEEKYS